MRRSSVCQNEGSGPFCDVGYDFLVGVTRVTRASKPRLAVLISAVFMSVMFMAHVAAQTYVNPVVTPVAADPSVIRAPDGTFYLYATQDDWADGQGSHYLPIFKSKDLVTWTYLKDALPAPPAWKEDGGFTWAPDISFRDGTYYLYYAASLWGDPNPCIALATSKNPEGPFEDLGRPVFCSQDIGVGNSIDPFVWNGGKVRTVVWGSGQGIYAVNLSEDGTRAVGKPVQLAGDALYYEAPYLIRRKGFYYLFLSAGSCCEGENSTYTLYVGRSRELTGPYLDKEGRSLLEDGGSVVIPANDTWVGPGHNAVIRDDAGNDWVFYHAIPRDDPRLTNGVNRRPVLTDHIVWRGGWPTVNGGAGPSTTPQPAPTVSAP